MLATADVQAVGTLARRFARSAPYTLAEIMKRFQAQLWLAAGVMFEQTRAACRAMPPDKPTPATDMLLGNLDHLADTAAQLGLPLSEKKLRRVIAQLWAGTKPTVQEFIGILESIEELLTDEMASVVFISTDPRKRQYFEEQHLFGEAVSIRFPEAIADIEQAGKCVALGLNTASVFHLMRVMEVGLLEIKRELGIEQWHGGWDSAVQQIKKKCEEIAPRGSAQTPEQRRLAKFGESAAGFVRSVSFAWRNDAMHVIKRPYSEEEAIEVFGHVRSFIRWLQQNLSGQGVDE